MLRKLRNKIKGTARSVRRQAKKRTFGSKTLGGAKVNVELARAKKANQGKFLGGLFSRTRSKAPVIPPDAQTPVKLVNDVPAITPANAQAIANVGLPVSGEALQTKQIIKAGKGQSVSVAGYSFPQWVLYVAIPVFALLAYKALKKLKILK